MPTVVYTDFLKEPLTFQSEMIEKELFICFMETGKIHYIAKNKILYIVEETG